jgi:hypothetical protein
MRNLQAELLERVNRGEWGALILLEVIQSNLNIILVFDESRSILLVFNSTLSRGFCNATRKIRHYRPINRTRAMNESR